jgi:hypothetical protein
MICVKLYVVYQEQIDKVNTIDNIFHDLLRNCWAVPQYIYDKHPHMYDDYMMVVVNDTLNRDNKNKETMEYTEHYHTMIELNCIWDIMNKCWYTSFANSISCKWVLNEYGVEVVGIRETVYSYIPVVIHSAKWKNNLKDWSEDKTHCGNKELIIYK